MSVPVLSIYSSPTYEAQLRQAVDALNSGKLVVLPTETIYGAAGLLSHPQGLQAIKALRGSATGPLTVHLASADAAGKYLGDIGDLGNRMMRKLWPGPVGLMFDVPPARRAEVAAALKLDERDIYAADGTITLRCPDDQVAQEVIGRVEGPVAVTVAWDAPAGSTTHSPAATLAQELDGKVELILDAGPTRYAQPSTLVKVTGEKYKIVRKGIYDERIIERLLRTTILFICSGNTCRSPMAEALARNLLAEAHGVPEADLEHKGLTVLSAGAYAMPGCRATAQAVEAVRDLGGDLTSHRSRQLTPELIHQADVIFTMGRGHAMAVNAMSPSAKRKTFTLDPAGDIEDPIGGNIELYRNLAGELRRLIESRLNEKELLRAGQQ